jgi:hypothetical protein
LPKLSKSFQWTPSQIAALAKGQKAIYILAVDELISGSESDDNCAIEDLVETNLELISPGYLSARYSVCIK